MAKAQYSKMRVVNSCAITIRAHENMGMSTLLKTACLLKRVKWLRLVRFHVKEKQSVQRKINYQKQLIRRDASDLFLPSMT